MEARFRPAGLLLTYRLFLLLTASTLWRHCDSDCTSTLVSQGDARYHTTCSSLNLTELKRSPASVLNDVQPSTIVNL